MNRMLNGEPLKTKWGTAKIGDHGYYCITSRKEGNNMKLLHCLIAADYFGDWINDPEDFFDIHHIDANKLNNCVLNLEPIPSGDHRSLHHAGKTISEKTKLKMSKAKKGENHPQSKYEKLWDISYVIYDKQPMFQRNRKPNPCKCFRLTYNGYRVNIGGFIDFLTPKIISDLIKECVQK